MQAIHDFVATADEYLWGPWMLAALALTGAFLTVGLRFIPWRKLPEAFKLAVQPSRGAGDISPFQALMTALSATVGTGNIAGVATAIYFGGPGALFYMWVIALVGMATKYSEAVCAIAYREVDELGNHVGGPMYYIKNGVGAKFPKVALVLAPAFAIFTALAGFGIGNGVQANSVAHALNENFAIPVEITGLLLMVVVGPRADRRHQAHRRRGEHARAFDDRALHGCRPHRPCNQLRGDPRCARAHLHLGLHTDSR